MLVWFFTAVYFLAFFVVINFVINNFINIGFAAQSFLAIFCWVVAFFASDGLAEYTEKKIAEKYSKK